jgi:DNA-binding transcriptional ArsR family regulator
MFWAWMGFGFVVFVVIGFLREGKETAKQNREILRLLREAERAGICEFTERDLVKFSCGKLRPGVAYVRLSRLVEDGIVLARMVDFEQHVQIRGFAYRLTSVGRALAEEMFP